jgi:hypothetical protein
MFTETKQDIPCRSHKAYFPPADCLSYKYFLLLSYIDIENLYPESEIRFRFRSALSFLEIASLPQNFTSSPIL